MSDSNGATTSLPVYKPKDFTSDRDVRWCPGCGDYAVLAGVRKTVANFGRRKEDYVFVSGIGCAARFPYYMDTYGVHSIHGRSLAVATGVKVANPELEVVIVSGDGDLLSIGGNHTIHAMRRNVDLTVVLLNNKIYGLTKGQYSPTSEFGKVTKSTPMGSLDFPLNPLAVAVAAGCTFIARCIDVDAKHLDSILTRAMKHKGLSFIEVYQDCNIFNHQAWFYASQKETKPETTVLVEHGKPMIFGAEQDKGLVRKDGRLQVVTLGDGVSESDLVVHDESNQNLAFMLSQLAHPEFPEPMGVLYVDESKPTYDGLLHEQLDHAKSKGGAPDLAALLRGNETWEVTA